MTTIIATQGTNWATIAADTQITTTDQDGYPTHTTHLHPPHTKLVTHPNLIIGIAGDLRAINLLQHTLKPPKPPTNPQKTDHYITNQLIPTIQHLYQQHQYTTPTHNTTRADTNNSQLIILTNATIYQIDNDYGWATTTNHHYAIGTGAPYALGHLHTQHITKTNSQHHLTQAIHVAAHYDPYTGGTTHTKTQTRKTPPEQQN